MSGTSLTDTNGERGMIKVMAMVICSLILLALFIFSMARLLGGIASGEDENDALMRNALIGRISPVGAVRTSAAELEQVASADGAAGAERGGEELVQGVCAGCHAAGAAGAPLLGDADAWAGRREAGLDALVASVVNGKGSMPARGGSDYTDEEIRRAVQHIALFEDTGEAAADEGAEGAEEGAGAPVEASATTMTDETAADVPSGGQVAPAEESVEETALAADAEQDGAVTTRDVAGESGDPKAVTKDAMAADVGTAAPSADMAAADLVALIASGTEPEGLTDEIKAQVDGVCAGCHVAGVAGAPKLGDKEAWGARAEAGLAALSQSVINGKGVMPARGSSTLTDEQVPIAIQYQMAKQQ